VGFGGAIIGGILGFLVGSGLIFAIWLGSFIKNLPWWVAMILKVFSYWLLGHLSLSLWLILIVLLVPTLIGAVIGGILED